MNTIEPIDIEMKTIKTNIVTPKIPVFEILKNTRCAKKTHKNKFRYTNIVLKPGEIYWGNIVVDKSRIYVDISECYKSKMTETNQHTERISIFIPIVFDMSGKYMMNIREYRGPIYF